LKYTALIPCAEPKLLPVKATDVPTLPEDTESELILGATPPTPTVKVLLATPATVTTTFPLVIPCGTGTTMLLELQLVGVEGTPSNVTVLVPCVEPKFVPVIVTRVPMFTARGDTSLILGPVEVTVKMSALLVGPLLWITTGPVVAPVGTSSTTWVSLQLVVDPMTPADKGLK
jgi:hypothetical protein